MRCGFPQVWAPSGAAVVVAVDVVVVVVVVVVVDQSRGCM